MLEGLGVWGILIFGTAPTGLLNRDLYIRFETVCCKGKMWVHVGGSNLFI